MLNFAVGPVQMDEEIVKSAAQPYHILGHRNFLLLFYRMKV